MTFIFSFFHRNELIFNISWELGNLSNFYFREMVFFMTTLVGVGRLFIGCCFAFPIVAELIGLDCGGKGNCHRNKMLV